MRLQGHALALTSTVRGSSARPSGATSAYRMQQQHHTSWLCLQELNGKHPATTPGLGLAGMQALQPFVSSLIVTDGEQPGQVPWHS